MSIAAEPQSGRKTVPIPKDFKSVKFNHDGSRVAFAAGDGKQYSAIVDGRPQQVYDNVTVVEFSPQGYHYYYGGQRLQLLRRELLQFPDITAFEGFLERRVLLGLRIGHAFERVGREDARVALSSVCRRLRG